MTKWQCQSTEGR